jgi:hypothetical protein
MKLKTSHKKAFSLITITFFLLSLVCLAFTLTAKADDTNLLPMPQGWDHNITGQRGLNDAQFPDQMQYPVSFDGYSDVFEFDNFGSLGSPYNGYTNNYNGTNGNGQCDREMDSAWTAVSAGEKLHYACDIYTGSSTIGDNNDPNHGYLIEFDAYGSGGRIQQVTDYQGQGVLVRTVSGTSTDPSSYNYEKTTVPFGSGGWVHYTMDWTVPSTPIYYDGFGTATNQFGTAYNVVAVIVAMAGQSSDPSRETAPFYLRNIVFTIDDDNSVISGSGDTIGDTSNAVNLAPGYMFAFPVTISNSGTVTSLGVDVATAVGSARMSLYSNYNSGTNTLSGLLTQTNSVVLNQGWSDLAVQNSVNVTYGTYYLGLQLTDSNAFIYYSPSGTQYFANTGTYGVFTDPSIALDSTTSTFNLRVLYDNSVVASPTPTPTPTANPTANPTASPTPAPTASNVVNYTTNPQSTLATFLIFNAVLFCLAMIAYMINAKLGFFFGIIGLVGTVFFASAGVLIVSSYTNTATLVTTTEVMPLGWFLMFPIILSIMNFTMILLQPLMDKSRIHA